MIEWLPLLVPIALVAVLYSSVGHGGASGYLAVMALAGVAPVAMKPTALLLNLAVSLLGTAAFFRAGHFTWRLFWPFAVVSIPCAFAGGRLDLPAPVFRLLIAAALAFAAVRLLWPVKVQTATRPLPWWAAVGAGAGIGFASGLIGVGGGIFLTPLLLVCRWADVKTAAGLTLVYSDNYPVATGAGALVEIEEKPAEVAAEGAPKAEEAKK